MNIKFLLAASALLFSAVGAFCQGSAINYQGRLVINGSPANGFNDFQFRIFTDALIGSQAGATITRTNLQIADGLVSLELDFGAGVFTGGDRWLQISYRSTPPSQQNQPPFTNMVPRVHLTPAPYAIMAGSASNFLGTVASAQLPPGVALLTAGTQTFLGTNSFLDSVGIGTSTPQTKLDVAGTVRMSGLQLGASSAQGSVVTASDSAGNAGWASELKVLRADRYSGAFPSRTWVGSANLIAGSSFNAVGSGVVGATVLGGGWASGNPDLIFFPPAVRPNYAGADFATVLGGIGNAATAAYASAVGGWSNTASGQFSFAAGHRAKAQDDGSFVWADAQNADYTSSAPNQFCVRAAGGIRLNGEAWMEDQPLFLRGYSDRNHFLSYRSTVAGISIDGPFLCGWNGGALGGAAPETASLTWDWQGNVWVSNNLSTATLTIRGGSDLAEPFPMSSDIPKGAVVVIDEDHPGQLKLSESAYDSRVAGIVSGANGINAGITLQQEGLLAGGQQVALSGRVYALADATSGPIKPGDLLTTSGTPGHVMKVSDHSKAQGAIVGKSMSALKDGTGMVLVLVNLQ